MKRIAFLAISVALLIGCQSAGTIWKATTGVDEFTDVSTKMVTVGEGLSNNLVITQSLKYYPFVGVQNGELFVGVRSGGRFRVPTGTVQLRIDGNPAWTITPEETPISLAPAIPTASLQNAAIAGTNLGRVQEQATQNVTKIMSPYTAATGEKARKILKEMIAGVAIKYRTVGMNQAASTTGEVQLDASFLDSLKSIGIDPAKI